MGTSILHIPSGGSGSPLSLVIAFKCCCVQPSRRCTFFGERGRQLEGRRQGRVTLISVRAAEEKQATDIKVLDLTGITAFADYFVICTGSNSKQVQAISDEVGLQLKHQARELPNSLEGYNQAEWVLADYGDLLVHIFSPKSREYYGLERLWRAAKSLEIPAA